MIRIITSFEDLKRGILKIKQETFSSHSLLFRGEGNSEWKLIPSLARYTLDNQMKSIYFEKLEEERFNEFKNENFEKNTIQKPFFKNDYQEEWLLLQQQQHIKSNTSLIDWSFNFKIALYFAIKDIKYDVFDGQIWIFIIENDKVKRDFDRGYLNFSPFKVKECSMVTLSGFLDENYLIKIAMRKKNTQFGAFFSQPYNQINVPLENNNEFNIFKFVVPKELKPKLRNQKWFLEILNKQKMTF